MSKVKMTVRQLTDLGLRDKVFEYLKINPYALNEGQIGYDDVLEFDSEFNPMEEVKYVEYEIGANPIGYYKGCVEVPKNASDGQIMDLIFEDSGFFVYYS